MQQSDCTTALLTEDDGDGDGDGDGDEPQSLDFD